MMNIDEMAKFLTEYVRVRRLVLGYNHAIEAIHSADPKSEFIMPLCTKAKELFGGVMELSKKIDEHTNPEHLSPDAMVSRQQFLMVCEEVMKTYDRYIREADGK